MGGSSKKVTVGYKYYLGMHMILCHGPIDMIRSFKVDDRIAWLGNNRGESVTVSAEGLFGGESREGGVSGRVDIEMGRADQGRNSYLQSKISADVPAYRGVVGAVLRHCYLGINPYLKKWAFRGQRIHVRQDGLPQWYDEKAEVSEILHGLTDYWRYKTEAPGSVADYSSPSFDDSSWLQGRGGFGNLAQGFNTPPAGTIIFGGVSPVPQGCSVWVRRNLGAVKSRYIAIEAWHDDGAELWFNGTKVTLQELSYFRSITQIPPNLVNLEGPNIVVMKVTDSFKNGSPAGNPTYIYAGLQLLGHADMNPTHIIRECLTDPDWGMGYAEADIDDDSFRAAADVLYDEKMGISLLWDRQVPIESFIQEVVKHIDAALYVSRSTGKFILKLIRADYDEETLPEFDPSNVEKVDNPSRPAFGELTNSVSVSYWNAATGKEASLTVHDTAMIQMQGAVINTTVQYPGFSNFTIASQVALRDLRTLSSPLLTCTIYTNQDARELNIGDVFKFSWPDFEIENVVMRVTGIAFGDGKSNKIRVTCTQDVFAFPQQGVLNQPDEGWTDIGGPPSPATDRLVLEAPYYELVQAQGQTAVDGALASTPEIGYLTVAAARPANALNASVWVNPGSGFEETMALDFCPTATLAADVGPMDTSWTFENGEDLDLVQVGTHCQIDGELVRVDSINLGTSTITVGRGVLDTTPRPHLTGARLYFWDVYSSADPTEYVDGETLEVKITPATNEGTLDLSGAPADVLAMASRAARPYPPGNMKINGAAYPETIPGSSGLSISWSHRDRRQQTGGDLVDTTADNIGPEAGTTYNVRIYNELGILTHTEAGISGTSYDYTTDQEILDNGGIAGDSDWNSVVALLHLNSDFTDETGKSWTSSGSPSINNTTYKFGGGSGFFNAGPYIEGPISTDWAFGTGDFTVECWVYATSMPTGFYYSPMGNWVSNTGGCFFLRPSGVMSWHSAGSAYASASGVFTINAWHHIAYSRQSGVGRLFVDGVQVASAADTVDFTWTQAFRIGNNRTTTDQWRGYVDEVRITKGVARYTAAFTPPSQEFYSNLPTARLNGKVRIELESERDSIVSYQAHNHTVERLGYGFNYGDRYGN